MPPGPRRARPDDRLPHRTRNLEIPGSSLTRRPGMTAARAARGAFARNDGAARKLPCPSCQSAAYRRALPLPPNQSDHSRIPHPIRGALRDRHERWARDAMDAIDHETNDFIADGEVAWSWRPDAGAKLAVMLRITQMTVARKPGHRGERVISRKTIAQGRPGSLG